MIVVSDVIMWSEQLSKITDFISPLLFLLYINDIA